MLKNLLQASSTMLAILMLAACGGARSPGSDNITSVSSNSSISWQAPSEYQDQTPLPLSEIAGYQIYVGTTAENMRLTANIFDSTITEYSLGKLGKGIRYIAVACYDVYGAESQLTQAIVVNIL